ncbi:MAG: hypothetical protein ACRDNZ_20475 [Streptosporangiaceae bacterium]
MLTRTYARCLAGLENVWISRMSEALPLNPALRFDEPGRPGQAEEDPE